MIREKYDSFARFAIEKDRVTKTKVKPKLFQPRKDLTLSTKAVDDLSFDEIEAAGNRFRNSQNESCLFGWAKTERCIFEQEGLQIFTDNHPEEGHTKIKCWPPEKQFQLDKQKIMAEASSVVFLADSKD